MEGTNDRDQQLNRLDDEIAALSLQLDEINIREQSKKGKYTAHNIPDLEIAHADYLSEIEASLAILKDIRLAHSIAEAVNADAEIIAEITQGERQSRSDRYVAAQMGSDDPELETPPSSISAEIVDDNTNQIPTIYDIVATQSTAYLSDDESTQAGPSMTYTERQADFLKKLAKRYQCVACTGRFPRALTVITNCNHHYCVGCTKTLFMKSTKDEELYPPRCCKEPIPIALVAGHMNTEELSVFGLASVEFATLNRTYCSNRACGVFIVPRNIEQGTNRATCDRCSTQTCTICKNYYHHGADCPEDPELQQTRELARVMGWQQCYACGRMVQLRSGCNHITCPCTAEFCYVCGVRWKDCDCATADPNRIEERAEEIVERDEGPDLAPAERRRRVDEVFADLQVNHECEHPGRFRRITGTSPRRGYRCEMCDVRHYKYILQCRHCHINVCENCRRHRV